MNNSIYSTRNGIIPVSMTSVMKVKESNMTDSTHYQGTMLEIFNTFTGVKISTAYNTILSMDGLKLFISQNFNIDVDRMFLLTPFGIKLKFSMIVHEQVSQIYVFDRKFFTPALLKPEKTESIVNELLSSIKADNLLNLIQPRESPVSNFNDSNFDIFVGNVSSLTPDSIINSSDLDFDGLRLFLNLIKRNLGWATALVADMKSTLFNDVYHHDYEMIENILNSLNSLIQYVLNMHKTLDKEVSTLKDVFHNLVTDSAADNWQEMYHLIEELQVSYSDNGRQRKVALAEFIDYNTVSRAASEREMRKETISQVFTKLQSMIDTEILNWEDSVISDYEVYKTLYLKPEWETSEKDNIKRATEIYAELEGITSQMVADMKDLPNFEELIMTTNNMSTFLSKTSITNLIRLTKIYNDQKTKYIPSITNLSNGLYKIQRKFYESREELQKKILNSTLISIVNIQLSLRRSTDLLNGELIDNIGKMQSSEIQLTLVKDFPLIFGVWMIAVLGNKKYGTAMLKLSRKTNEILEMMNFIEQQDRKKWLTEFIDSIGTKQLNIQFLNDEKLKNAFTDTHLPRVLLVPETFSTETSLPPQLQPRRHNSDTIKYLSPFNKLLQNLNNFPMRTRVDHISQNLNIETKPIHDIPFIEGFVENVTLKDLEGYMMLLHSYKYDSRSIGELNVFMKNLGIKSSVSEANDGHHLYKSLYYEQLGSMDSKDEHYMRVFKNFITSFKFNDVNIDVKLSEHSNTISKTDDGNIIQAYIERIKKLESMLLDTKFTLFDHKWSRTEQQVENADLETDPDETNDIAEGQVLGRHTIKLPPSHYTERISELERENIRLKERIEELEKSKDVQEMQQLNKIISDQDVVIKQFAMIEEDNAKLVLSKEETIAEMRKQIKSMHNDMGVLRTQNKELVEQVNELGTLNGDLIENMSHKEAEYMSENKESQKEKNSLQIKIEELQDVNNHYIEILPEIENIDKLLDSLVDLVVFFVSKLQGLSQHIFSNMKSFCLALEIMGLMLVESKGKLEIKRVKGLRIQKRKILSEEEQFDEDWEQDDERLFTEVVASQVYKSSEETLNWIEEYHSAGQHIASQVGSKTESLSFNENSETTVQSSKLKEANELFTKIKAFKGKVDPILSLFDSTNLESRYKSFISKTILSPELILPKIHQRFEDVETLARKLQKEKVQMRSDIKNMTKKISQQLVLRNFENGDLVLFLRTFFNGSNNSEEEMKKDKQPWAIFNIGSPNYYLRPTSEQQRVLLDSKDWFVGRLTRVTEHRVTTQNQTDTTANPFDLAVDTVWFFVETEEESDTKDRS